LFDCGSPSVCLFSSNTGFSVVQFYDRNLQHRTLSTYVNHPKYVTKVRYSSIEFTTMTTTSVTATTSRPNSVGNSSIDKAGKSLVSYYLRVKTSTNVYVDVYSWMATLKNDLSLHNPTYEDAIEMALGKPLWGLLAASGAMH